MLRRGLLSILQAWQARLAPDIVPDPRIYIAFSGGLDSSVLLHLACSLQDDIDHKLAAIHINHNLHDQSNRWAEHCRRLAHSYGVTLHCLNITVGRYGSGNPEAQARTLRYAEIATLLQANDVLLTAHHQDDQLETFFLQLFRGAGVLGVAAMPAIKPFGKAWHGRPFLPFHRHQLVHYAEQNRLQWIEDGSNADIRYDRNYIRHELMPVIQRRWRHVAGPLSRYIGIAADTQQIIDALAASDLEQASNKADKRLLDCQAIARLSVARQNNLLRYWLRHAALPLPAAKHLNEIRRALIKASPDTAGVVSWPGANMYRYRDCLYASARLFNAPNNKTFSWSLAAKLTMNSGDLQASKTRGKGLKYLRCEQADVSVRFYQGGESLRLPANNYRSRLKKLFQGIGLPPWQRRFVPLIYVGEELAMVAGLWIAAEFIAASEEPSWEISWTGFDELLFIKR